MTSPDEQTASEPSPDSRFRGAVLGAAIGDALGHPTEFLSLGEIRRRFGQQGVRGFELWWERDGRRFAPYTDDTQMAEIVLRALVGVLESGGSMDDAMTEIARGFVGWIDSPQGGHRAPGNACLAGARRLRDGVPWREAGGAQAGGCGSVMRAYPFGLLLAAPEAEFWAVEHSRMTHQDPIALAACAAMAVGIALELDATPPEAVLDAMVSAAARHDVVTAQMAEQAVADALTGTSSDEVLGRLEGWAAHEAIAAAMFVIARCPEDVSEGLLLGANTTGDSDSIATLAGALLGARLGIEAFPVEWVRDVERSAELLVLADRACAVRARK